MAKQLLLQTERMKKDFAEFNTSESGYDTEEAMNHIAEELIYFASYAEKNKVKTMYDLEEKLNLPFEAYLDSFETEVKETEGFDYSKVLEAFKKMLTTFRDDWFFEAETISTIGLVYFKNKDIEAGEAFLLSYLEEDKMSALAYQALILGFLENDNQEKAKEYYLKAKDLELDEPELLSELSEQFS